MTVPTGVDAIFKAIDDAAVKMLDRLDMQDIDKDGETIDISAADAVKVFEAVVAYAALRAKVEPPKKLEASSFERIRTQYHGGDATDGDAPERRTRRKPSSPPVGTAGTA